MISKIEKAVRKAGEHLLKGFYGAKDVSFKGKIDLVTQYDVEVEKILLNELSFMLPEYSFVAEETSRERTDNPKVVYIDPIDGTTNFVHGFPFCCISVGVYEHNVGMCGFVYNPIMDEFFFAENGNGAYLNSKRIHTSSKERVEDCLVATGFPYSSVIEKSNEIHAVLNRVLTNTRGIRRAGSAALDLCYVARGIYDMYYEFNLSPWDIAAGAVIASEAGADVFGKKYGCSAELYEEFIFAATKDLSSELYDIVIKK